MGKEDQVQQYSFSFYLEEKRIIVNCDQKLYEDYVSISTPDNIKSLFPEESLMEEEIGQIINYFISFIYGVSLVMNRFNIESPQITIIDNPQEKQGFTGIGYFPEPQVIGISREFILDLLRTKREYYVSGDYEEGGKLLILSVDPTMNILSFGIQETIHHYQNLQNKGFSDNTQKWSERDEEIEAYNITKEIVCADPDLKDKFQFVDDYKPS